MKTYSSFEYKELPAYQADRVVAGVALIGQVLLNGRPMPARGRGSAGGADGADGRVVSVRLVRRWRRWGRRGMMMAWPVRPGRIVGRLTWTLVRRIVRRPWSLVRWVVVRSVGTLARNYDWSIPGSPGTRCRSRRCRGCRRRARGSRSGMRTEARVIRVYGPQSVGCT